MSLVDEEKKLLSIIVPVFNEEENIQAFLQRTNSSLKQLPCRVEYIFVDDGSTDQTYKVLIDEAIKDKRIKALRLSRNFGKESAISAGIDFCQGDLVVFIDADLQHPPEIICTMYEESLKGFDVVLAKRLNRKAESFSRQFGSNIYHYLSGKIFEIKVPQGIGDFRMVSKSVITSLKKMTEKSRNMKGIFAWVGFSSTTVMYTEEERFAGSTKWNYLKLIKLALDGIFAFSTAPLRLITVTGVTIASLAFFSGIYYLFRFMFVDEPVRGFPSLFIAILFLNGLQILMIGIVGEYVGRTYGESKSRPIYILSNAHGIQF